mmetsp:Transcript_32041/g.90902  ORF Transcript_32041/g.90902 Transcript_32041/m.90902 type:complete len:86 (+) Transcript_32041:66-323(+)
MKTVEQASINPKEEEKRGRQGSRRVPPSLSPPPPFPPFSFSRKEGRRGREREGGHGRGKVGEGLQEMDPKDMKTVEVNRHTANSP